MLPYTGRDLFALRMPDPRQGELLATVASECSDDGQSGGSSFYTSQSSLGSRSISMADSYRSAQPTIRRPTKIGLLITRGMITRRQILGMQVEREVSGSRDGSLKVDVRFPFCTKVLVRIPIWRKQSPTHHRRVGAHGEHAQNHFRFIKWLRLPQGRRRRPDTNGQTRHKGPVVSRA
jgi:hypothetical protein